MSQNGNMFTSYSRRRTITDQTILSKIYPVSTQWSNPSLLLLVDTEAEQMRLS